MWKTVSKPVALALALVLVAGAVDARKWDAEMRLYFHCQVHEGSKRCQ